MVNFCAFFGCTKRSNRDRGSFYRFPYAPARCNSSKNRLASTRLHQWSSAIKRTDLLPTNLKRARVCSKHFISDGRCIYMPVDNIVDGAGNLVDIDGKVFHLNFDPPCPSTEMCQNVEIEEVVDVGAGATGEWGEGPTKLLLALYPELKANVEQRKILTLKKMWDMLSQKLSEEGYTFSPLQCMNRWKTLERSWKRKTENNNKTGRGRKTCPYEKELTDILVTKASIFPKLVMGTGTPINRQDLLQKCGISPTGDDESRSEIQTPPKELEMQVGMACYSKSADKDPGPVRNKKRKNVQQLLVEMKNSIEAGRAERAARNEIKQKRTAEFRAQRLVLMQQRLDDLREQNSLLRQLLEARNSGTRM